MYLLAGILLVSYSNKKDGAIEGLWIGAFKSDVQRENMVVKFVSQGGIELYRGEVDEKNRVTGSYQLQGDSAVQFTYKTPDGKEIVMHGSVNKRRNFVEGDWKTTDHQKGEFYLKKQDIEELYVQP